AQASSPPSTPRAPAKTTSGLDKLFYGLCIGRDKWAKKSTIDLPPGTSTELAFTLAETIGRQLGETENDNHRTWLKTEGLRFQIRFATSGKHRQVSEFVKLLIRQCERLGIEDEPTLVKFLRECPGLSSALGDGRLYLGEKGLEISFRMQEFEIITCVRE